METSRFDHLTKTLTAEGTRRGALRLLATLPVVSGLAALLDGDDVAAVNGRRKRRKKRHHHQKGDGKRNRRGKRKGNNKAKDQACSSHSDCGGDALCLSDGACQACTVTCTGTPAECGTALQTAMNAGGTLYVCPGIYQGGFILTAGVTVIGAGQGGGSGDTILDGNDAARVVQINTGTETVGLEQVRITGGAVENSGAGIRHQGTTLRMTDCTVTGNTANGPSGGGIQSESDATLELTRCTVSDNHAPGGDGAGGGVAALGTATVTDCVIEGNDAAFGGGVFVDAGLTTLAGSTAVRGNVATVDGGGIYVIAGTLTIAETCRVTENTAPEGNGGGIFNTGTVTLQGADPSPIVVDNCPQNCAGNPVPKCQPGGTCPP